MAAYHCAPSLLFVALAAIYIVLPLDLIPDFLLPLGVVDDAGLVFAAMHVFVRQAKMQQEDDALLSDRAADETADSVGPPAQSSIVPAASAPLRSDADAPPARIVYREAPRRSNAGCAALVFTLIVSPFVGFAILLLSSSAMVSAIITPIVDLLDPPASVGIATSRTIVTGIKSLGQLVTVKADVAKTDVKVEVHQGFLNSGYYSANHLAIGAIEAGINFDTIDDDSLRFESGRYTVTLPAPSITSCRIEHIDQNQQSFTLLAADWDLIRQLAQYDAIVQFANEQIETGILGRAKDEAEIRIGEFVSNLTDKPAVIEFMEADDETELPSSCRPELPDGWEKDDEGAWKRAD